MESLRESTVVVTGAASGIGQATARAFAKQGAKVIAVDRDADGVNRLAAELGTPTRALARDLGDVAARERLVVELTDAGGIDVLVNAAGVIRLTPIDQVTVAEWRLIHTVNAEAVFFLCQGLAPQLRDNGAIVNLSSTAAKTGTTLEAAAYAASKAAVLSLTRAFAFHLAPRGVTVNAICPGVIETPMQQQVVAGLADAKHVAATEIEQLRNSMVPLGRSGTAAEVANLIVWISGPQARYLTGQAINICGGLVTW